MLCTLDEKRKHKSYDIVYNVPIGIVEDLQGQIRNLQDTRQFLQFEIVSRSQIKKL